MKRMSWIPLALSLAVVAAACGNSTGGDAAKEADSVNAAKADTGASAASPSQTMAVDEKTSAHMVKIADAGLAEVRMGQLAQEKAKNKSVKDFGAMMVKDHSAANDELKAIAVRKNVTLPVTPGDEHQKKIEDLTKKTGTDFDKEYMEAMVKGHKDVADELEKAAKDITDADIKAFVDKTLPVVLAHLEKAKQVQKTLK